MTTLPVANRLRFSLSRILIGALCFPAFASGKTHHYAGNHLQTAFITEGRSTCRDA
jgi:hypothetical protein